MSLTHMSFREKSAWVMASILILGMIWYFEDVVSVSRALGHTAPPIIAFIIAYVLFVAIWSAVIMSIVAGASAREANAPADEREQIIGDKAGNWSGYVLAVPAVGALFHYGVHGDGNMLFHLVFLSLMLSQISEYVFQIILYRRAA